MSFETVERLKREYTDKWVLVDVNTPELRRFAGLNGRVKTINMNGRALVQFDNPVDISWYDIDLAYLQVIDAPQPKKTVEKHAEPAEKKASAAAKSTIAKPAAATSTAGTAEGTAGAGEKPLSKLELARMQAAAAKAKASGEGAAAAPAGAAGADKPMSKLEMARAQAAAAKAKAAGTTAPDAPAAASPAVEQDAVAPTSKPNPPPSAATPATMVDENGKPLSKLEMARRQGAFKGNK